METKQHFRNVRIFSEKKKKTQKRKSNKQRNYQKVYKTESDENGKVEVIRILMITRNPNKKIDIKGCRLATCVCCLSVKKQNLLYERKLKIFSSLNCKSFQLTFLRLNKQYSATSQTIHNSRVSHVKQSFANNTVSLVK